MEEDVDIKHIKKEVNVEVENIEEVNVEVEEENNNFII
jgi:hypothetical protein